ncbi:hypothetical protein ABAC460_05515 [Asticcacaulis sp. AC460]|uniref:hypothetical protein n=1 Tax=Asticcacaulis sp. AC460 TaxID=1282360 RepID=UPI0003C3FBD9|nr:hypothetical protein [Asticcacaulis sp. AC460]ESQ91798.1 hypothetical protein ABAC460_05515 [Asticcacaulis sp. AC460]
MKWKLMAAMAFAGTAAVGLSGCEKQLKAPNERGVCFSIGHPASGEVKFNVVARDVESLEKCAVHIYTLHRTRLGTGTAGEWTEGSYGGSFLWANAREVRYSQRYEGPRMPFLVRAPGNRLVQPGSIVQEEDLPTGPITVERPDYLPTKPAEPAKPAEPPKP